MPAGLTSVRTDVTGFSPVTALGGTGGRRHPPHCHLPGSPAFPTAHARSTEGAGLSRVGIHSRSWAKISRSPASCGTRQYDAVRR